MGTAHKRRVTIAVAYSCGVSASKLWTNRSKEYREARCLGFYVLRHLSAMTIREISYLTSYADATVQVGTQSIVGRLIDGDKTTVERLKAIARFLGVSEDYLLPSRNVAV